MSRDHYLKNGWKRYQAMPVAEFFGRIEKIEARRLVVSGQCFDLDENCKIEIYPFADIAQVGDIICFGQNPVEQVTLLVPGRSLPPKNLPKRATDQNWSEFLTSVRKFFADQEFEEVQTPTLVHSPGMEEYLHPFEAVFINGDQKQTFFLPTSPEFGLKKKLVSGQNKIFEIKTCFRNQENGSLHQPEFQMLEWYRGFATLDSIAEDVELLLEKFTDHSKLEKISVQSAFKQVIDQDLSPDTTREQLLEAAKRIQIHTSEDDSWTDLFHRIMLEKIEPWLANRGPVLLYDYPPSEAAMARINQAGWAQRFELYWRGFEIANAFDELNDPVEQRMRFESCNNDRKKLGFEPMAIDEEFLAALDYGMPPSAGIALGLERLFMAIHGLKDIREVRSFSRLKCSY